MAHMLLCNLRDQALLPAQGGVIDQSSREVRARQYARLSMLHEFTSGKADTQPEAMPVFCGFLDLYVWIYDSTKSETIHIRKTDGSN